MREYDLGREGEQKARILLKGLGFEVQSPDWLGFKEGEWTCFEVKRKERFLSPPFDGHGLDQRQINLRMRLLFEKDIRTFLMIFEVPTELTFGEYLDILTSGKSFTTRNNIVIFPLNSFRRL